MKRKKTPGQKVIETREKAHGNYKLQADTAQDLKNVLRGGISPFHDLPAYHRESLDMLCIKISRIIHGNPNEPDHWRDIAGYATLSLNIIEKGTHL